MYKPSNILWGVVLIIIGIIFGLNALDITKINIFFDGWWTLFIIIPCFIDLFNDKSKTGNIIGLLIGVFLLLGCNNIIEFNLIWKLIVPVALVIIGISFIFKDTINGKIKKELKKKNKNNVPEYYATFGGQNIDFSKEEFKGCNLNAVFGKIKCNLHDIKSEEDVIVNAIAIFGEINILVPSNVNVKVLSTPIFGGVSDERKNKSNFKDSKITLYINATCMFGGITLNDKNAKNN